jgi:hypothetical protein
LEPNVGRRAQQAGRIPLPPVEIVEIDNLDPTQPARPEPVRLRERSGWLVRLVGRNRASRFILEGDAAPAEIVGWREDFALLEIDASGRPVLHVLPGMRGELRIGVSRMSVAQMLADPALECHELGGARLPLPNGARLRIECGPTTFVARVGGPPLVQTTLPATSASLPQLALGA